MSLPNEKSIALGARLQAVRIANGFERARDFQIKLDLPSNTYYQWESGRRTPSDKILLKISKACTVSFEWLKKGTGDIFQGVDLKKEVKSEKKEAIEFSETSAKEKLKAKYIDITSDKKPINQELLTTIIEKLTQAFITAKKPVNPKRLAQFSIQAYTDIVTNQPDEKRQMNLLNLTLNAYKRFIKND
jgi:transcriptional regulator with XRE-family HTH domain